MPKKIDVNKLLKLMEMERIAPRKFFFRPDVQDRAPVRGDKEVVFRWISTLNRLPI